MLALALSASNLAGCSGGGSTAPLPATPEQQQSVQAPQLSEPISVLTVKRGEGAGHVVRGDAYATPMQGRQPASLHLSGARTPQSTQWDLSYYGGPTLTSAQSINLYVNCGNSCWGGTSPAVFQRNLAPSTFMHVVDQYTGSTANNRYTFGGSWTVNYDTSSTLQDQDIYNIVYAVAQTQGTGYGKIYHVFLQQGVSQCSQSAGGCYAQQYCAYHGNVDYGDIGHAIYTVEPYQGINGCQFGSVVNATASTLSHETFESITDPDVPNNVAWYNNTYGEIGDICQSSRGYVTLNGTQYYIQREWSNRRAACTFS